MNARFLIFITTAFTILSLASFYVGHRFMSRFHWAATHRGAVWLSVLAFIVLQVVAPYLHRMHPEHLRSLYVFHWLSYATLGAFTCLFLYTLIADASLLAWKFLLKPENAVDVERRGFMTVGLATLVSAVGGAAQAAMGPKVYQVDIPLEGLPPEFDGFKIVQLTDLHVGPLIERGYTERVVEIVNGLDADVVALTGDFVDGTVEQLTPGVEPLSKIKSKEGMFFVTGNHEYYWGIQGWLNEFRRLGAKTLLNEHVVIKKNEAEVVLAGVTDISAGQMVPSHASDPRKALEGAPADAVKILLAHQPNSYEGASKAGFHLQISGHTHGGQFFPWSIVVSIAQRYYKGLNKHENMWVYVSRGTGYWGPPLRFAIPSEVTLLTLRRT